LIIRLLSQTLLFRATAAISAASLVMLITPSSPIQMVGIMTLLMCPMIMSHRATPFEAVIPMDARRFLLTRICVGLALTCLPLIAWIVSGHLRGVPADPAAAFLGAGQEVRLLALPIAALAVILPHAHRPGVLPLPGHRSIPALVWAVLAIGCAAAIWLLPVGVATVVLAAAAAGTLAFTWHRMPHSYQVAPPGAERAGRTLPAAGAAAPGTAPARWWRPMLATVVPGRLLFVILLMGVFGLSDMWFLYLIILFVPDLVGSDRPRLQWMHTLPVPRTALVWAALAPATLSLLAVLLTGALIGPALFPRFNALYWLNRPHEYSRDHEFERRTMVPLEYWRIAPRGEAPVARAPWGETTTTDTVTLPGLTLYNPYSAMKGSSPELIEWQFGRASAAVHGRSFTTAEYHADGFAPPRRVTRSAPIYLIGGSLALTFVILIAWLASLVHWHALATRPVLRHGVSVFTGAVAAGVVVLELYFMFRHGAQLVVPAGTALAMRMAAALPNIGIVAVVAALPVVAAYSLLHWQIGRSDVAGVIRQG
jgi:hypothetical protein